MESKSKEIVDIFNSKLKDKNIAVPVAAICALAEMVQKTKVSTLHELDKELNALIKALTTDNVDFEQKYGLISKSSLNTGCEMFKRFITRSFNEGDITTCIKEVKERSDFFTKMSLTSRKTISMMGRQFIKDNCTILIHGKSRVVLELLKEASRNKNISVIATEGSPLGEGYLLSFLAAICPSRESANDLAAYGIKTTIIPDCGVGYYIQDVDIVLMGAVVVTESGGVVNTLGTLQISILASVYKKPVYIAAESYKFGRTYPLKQTDLEENENGLNQQKQDKQDQHSANPSYSCPKCDYTPPQYITLLLTDLGILDPSSVGEELMKLYA